MKFQIERWDPSTMLKEHRKVLYVGRSGSGKSVAMRAVLRSMPTVDLAIGFTPTDETYEEMRKIIPASCIHRELDLFVLDRCQHLQKELAHKNRAVCLIADDCAYNKSMWRTNTMRSLFMNARHNRISLHFSMQYLMDIDPSLRSNVDYVIATAENIHANKQRLWKCFFGIFKTYSEFDQVFSQVTRDYACIVLDQTQPSASIENSVFWYKADLTETAAPFKLGRSVYWRLDRNPPPQRKPSANVLTIEEAPPRRALVDAI